MRSFETQGLSRRVQGSENEGPKKRQGFFLPALPGVGTMASTMGLETSLEDGIIRVCIRTTQVYVETYCGHSGVQRS